MTSIIHACSANNLPSVFVSKQGKKYAYISYDSLSMFSGDPKRSKNQKATVTKVMKYYKDYAKTFSLSDDAFQAAGGETAFGFVVKREHANFIAEGLYHFLLTRK
jgi:hypothetical protein